MKGRSRPGLAGLVPLVALAPRADELSKCAYCPKLCRAACVVSEVEGREALIPGNKMSSAFDVARGEPLTAERAEQAWACSNCFRCREVCDHKNPVADTLNDVRAAYVARGHAPAPIQALLSREAELAAASVEAHTALARDSGQAVHAASETALLLGCRYARALPAEALAAIRLAAALVGPVRLLAGCCGAWQRAAGAPERANQARQQLSGSLAGSKRLLVLDPRCALELRELGATTLVELAARQEHRLRRLPLAEPLRYHDNCALGRGLGLYDEPRALLARVLGRRPLELETTREHARCSGGGGLLPVSRPETSREAAKLLVAEHQRLGGGTLVTSCASSLSQLRRAGARVVDLVSVLASAIDDDTASGAAEQERHG